MGMEFSEYDGPSTVELEQAWSGLSEDQQTAIQSVADEHGPEFFMAIVFGDIATAESVAEETLRQAHTIAGLPF